MEQHATEFCAYKSKLQIVFGAFYMLFLATYFLTPRPPIHENMYISLYVMLGGVIFVCLPMFCWLNEFSSPTVSATLENYEKRRPVTVVNEEPPDYDSVVTSPNPEAAMTAPPTYEEVIHISEDLQVAVPETNTISVGITLCPVHSQSCKSSTSVREVGVVVTSTLSDEHASPV